MRPKFFFPGACAAVAFLLVAVSRSSAQAADGPPVFLGDSIKSVPVAPVTDYNHRPLPYISRSTLKASESAASMSFEVVLKMRNIDELEARVNRGEHVPDAEMAAKYEPLASDYQAVADWLKGEGFTIERQSSRHLALFVRGNVSQVAQALKVNFARVTADGKEYTSAVTAPEVPAKIAPLLISINGLQPHIHAHKHFAKPNASGSGGASYTPAQIAQAYQATGLYSKSITGAGQTIAIVIDTFPTTSDLTSFWSTYGINQSIGRIDFIQAVAGTLPAPSGEETLDTEWASAMAPGANVRVYAVADSNLATNELDQAYQAILDDATADSAALHPDTSIHQMTMSYGGGELDAPPGQIMSDHTTYFVELANAGVTCFASSGDGGPYPGTDSSGNPELEVEAPASDSSVTGVGGTTLTNPSSPNATNEYVWGDNTTGSGSGGGVSTVFAAPTWQTTNGVAIGTMREVPDIACAADPNYGADVYFQGSVEPIGGTSWSSPTWAGFCALINQSRANAGLSEIGLLGPHIYPLIGTANFRDITMGTSLPISGIYSANPGYDEATGIGVPLMQTLAATLSATKTVTQSPIFATINQGDSTTITATASGSPVSFQWQRMPIGATTWTNLSNTGAYSGTTTSSLTITGSTTAMSGDQFQCVATYAGAVTVTSALTSTLIVENPWIVATLAGTAGTSGLVNNTMGTSAEFSYPTGVALDTSTGNAYSGDLFVTDLDNAVIRAVSPSGAVSTPAFTGTGGTSNTTGTNDVFTVPRDIAFDSTHDLLYVSDEGTNLIDKITLPGGAVTQFAGTTSTTSPIFFEPRGIAVDPSGNVYVADSGNNVIRKVTTGGAVTTFAGSTAFTAGYKDATGASALFNQPIGLAIDSAGANLYVADYGNEVVRKITVPGGVVTTIGGKGGVAGCLDGAATTQALFNTPRGVTVDGNGNVYVTDSSAPSVTNNQLLYTGNDLLREISGGVVTTLAGQAGIPGATNPTGSAFGSAAQFYSPTGMTISSSGTLYLADAGNNTIRTAMLPTTTVSVSATVPYASLNEDIVGQFTISRTGSTVSSLTVNYAVAGTAIGNTDYSSADLTGSVTIPAGASSVTLAVTPLTNNNPPSRTVQVTLTTSATGVTVNKTPATVTISEAPVVLFSQWESNHTISGAAAAGTPLNDGIPTYLKYFYDINPNAPMTGSELATLPTQGATMIGGADYLTLTYHESATATGAIVTAQSSPDLVNWTTLPGSAIVPIGIDSASGDLIMQAQTPLTTFPLFLRLNIAQP